MLKDCTASLTSTLTTSIKRYFKYSDTPDLHASIRGQAEKGIRPAQILVDRYPWIVNLQSYYSDHPHIPTTLDATATFQ
jgi:hypothetical protein